jgi:hypothetical protein
VQVMPAVILMFGFAKGLTAKMTNTEVVASK